MKYWRRLLHYALPYRNGLTSVAGLMLVSVGLGLLAPWPMKILVDNVLAGESLPPSIAWIEALPGADSSHGLVAWLMLAIVFIFVATTATGAAKTYIEKGVGGRMVRDLGADVFDHAQRLSLPNVAHYRTGDLTKRITSDTHCVRELVLGAVLPAITSAITLVAMFVILWNLHPTLSLLALTVTVPLGITLAVFAGPMTRRARAKKDLEAEVMVQAEQTLAAVPVVQAFNQEDAEYQRLRDLSQATIKASLRSQASKLQFESSAGFVTALGTSAIIFFGGLNVLSGSLTLGSLLVFLSYVSSLYAPIETLFYLGGSLAETSAGAQRVFTLLETERAVQDPPHPTALSAATARGHVAMESVTFGYEPGRPVLKDISLEARQGEIVAIVGRTGAGKSTLMSLIPRFFDPWTGQVTVGGIDLRSLALKDLRSEVAIVSQEPRLLPVSVADNISYGRPEASRRKIEAAAIAAGADEFIRRLPDGYETVLGERGATLSGGQRQRLTIARALLKDSAILILDEPTSALDGTTEAALVIALERLMENRTTFVIAHRLSTIQRADWIVVLDEGRVVEIGKHEDLLSAGGLYHRFHHLQFGPTQSPVKERT